MFYLPSHFCLSSDVRQEIYLLPWLVATCKQCSFPRTLLCRGFTSMSWPVRSMECIVTELVSRDSWDLEERIRELMMFLKGYTSTWKMISTLSLQFSLFLSLQDSGLGLLFPGTLKNRWNMAMFDTGLLCADWLLRLTQTEINEKTLAIWKSLIPVFKYGCLHSHPQLVCPRIFIKMLEAKTHRCFLLHVKSILCCTFAKLCLMGFILGWCFFLL